MNQPATYRATMKSAAGGAGIGMAVVGLAFMVVGVMAGGALWFVGALGLLLAVVGVAVIWPLWKNSIVLRMTETGISGKGLGRDEVPWREVTDLRLETTQGNYFIRVVLAGAPGSVNKRSWLTNKGPNDRLVALGPLRKEERLPAWEVASAMFMAQGGEKAEAAAHQQAVELIEEVEFDDRMKALTPRAWAMPLMMGLCVAMWGANLAGGLDFMAPRADDLYRWGGSSASAVQSGEWWRLVTAMFLHGGIIHLALNMYALWEAGLMVTRLFGNRGFLLVYLGTGLVGGGLSLHFAGQMHVSVGASGAVFGVIGALLASVVEHRGRFPGGRGKQLIGSLAFFILYSLAYGFSKDGIDNAAHVGGLLSGLLAGWLLVEKIDDGPSRAQRAMRFAITAVVLAGSAWALVASAPPAKRDVGTYFQSLTNWQVAEKEMSAAFKAVDEDSSALRKGTLNDAQFVERLGNMHRPAIAAVEAKFSALRLPEEERSGKFSAAQLRYIRAYLGLIDADLRATRGDTAGLAEERARREKQMADAGAEIDALNAEKSPK